MSLRVVLAGTEVSQELSASTIRVIRIGELETTLAEEILLYPDTMIVFLRCVLQLLVTANVVPNWSILISLIMVAIFSSETSVPTREERRNIPEDDILHSHRRENHKSSIFKYV
jgi:hypothetical protein